MTSLSVSRTLPRYFFDAWRFDMEADCLAEDEEVSNWTLSSMAERLLSYHINQSISLQASTHIGPPTLSTSTVIQLSGALATTEDVPRDIEIIVNHLSQVAFKEILRDVRLPYRAFRHLCSLPQAVCSPGCSHVDIDEAILKSERYHRCPSSRSVDQKHLISLSDLLAILSFSGQTRLGPDVVEYIRKDPPLGGFEMFDYLRKWRFLMHSGCAAFARTFERITNNLLRGLNWDNILVAGGLVLTTLLHTEEEKDHISSIRDPDMDIYIYGVDAEGANRKAEEIYNVWAQNLPPTNKPKLVIRSAKTIDLLAAYPYRRLQIILRLLSTPLDILSRFDLDACAIAFNGTEVVMLPRCARAIETGYNIFTMDLIWGHHLGHRRETRIRRIIKYADRGFGLRILPSYVRSLEEFNLASEYHIALDTLAEHCMREAPTNLLPETLCHPGQPGEPGLKTLRRAAHTAKSFVYDNLLGPDARLSQQGLPIIPLHAVTREHFSSESRLFRSRGLQSFEMLVRCCEAWRLDRRGNAVFAETDTPGSEDTAILDMPYTPALQYNWDATFNAEELMKAMDCANSDLQNELVWKVQGAWSQSHNDQALSSRGVRATRSVALYVFGPDLRTVQAGQITVPLFVPNKVRQFVADNTPTSRNLVPAVTSRPDTGSSQLSSSSSVEPEESEWRLWIVDHNMMWSGQDPVMDEVTELMWLLFYSFKAGLGVPAPSSPRQILSLARYYRRRATLPEISDMGEGPRPNAALPSLRESLLFRPWFNHVVRESDRMEPQDSSMDWLFWQEGDEGSWGEEGVTQWVTVSGQQAGGQLR